MSALPDTLDRYDASREPFAEGIDPRVLGRALDPTTGEVSPPHHPDARLAPWPPRSKGPLPPAASIPPDVNIATSLDELDLWAHELDRVETLWEQARRELAKLRDRDARVRAPARRVARQNPVERGRRTAGDIDSEVEEAAIKDGVHSELLNVEAEVDVYTSRMFNAKDQMRRLTKHIDAAGPPPGSRYRGP